MTIPNIESFLLKDLRLKEIILRQFGSSQDDSQDDSSIGKVDRIVREVIAKVNSLKDLKVGDKDKISGELIDIIQLTRRVVYSAIRESQDKDRAEAVATTNGVYSQEDKEDKEEMISKDQKYFDEQFKSRLKSYLLEAIVTDIVNEVYMEYEHKDDMGTLNGRRIRTLQFFFFVNLANGAFLGPDFDLDKCITDFFKKEDDEKEHTKEKQHRINMCRNCVIKIRSSLLDVNGDPLSSEIAGVCDDIFKKDPSVSSREILYVGGYQEIKDQEIKEGVLVSFLRIILYLFKFIVDYLDKKHIYRLDELRLFKDGKEKPRDEQEAKRFQQERLLDYKAGDRALKLQAVELEKGKKQHYAVLDCFKGQKNPPNGTIIVFHGNNADIHTKPLIDNCKSICEGYRVIMMEYPGFEPSHGPLSKENLSKVTHQLFEDAKRKDLIKGGVTVMGEDFGCYYAALLAKKIDEKERGSCKGLMLSGQSIYISGDPSKSASCISDAEHLDTKSILRSLPKTMPIAFLNPEQDKDKFLGRIYHKKEEAEKEEAEKAHDSYPYYYYICNDGTLPILNYKASDTNISRVQVVLNNLKQEGLKYLRERIMCSEVLIHAQKPFLAESASPVSNQKKGLQDTWGRSA